MTDPRLSEMISLYTQPPHQTLKEIGKVFGVSRERVRQMLKKEGITGKQGGKQMRAATQRARRGLQKMDYYRRLAKKTGMTLSQYALHVGKYGSTKKENSPLRMHGRQKTRALKRGETWNLIFTDWWKVWVQSGKWEQRGKTRDSYVLGRIDHQGPWQLGNVRVVTLRENSISTRAQ